MRNTPPFIVLLALLILTSCASNMPRTDTAKYMHIQGAGVLHHPVIADLDVRNMKASGSATGLLVNKEQLKVQAVAAAMKSSSADVIVEPVFDITPLSSSRIEVTATGFPANYRNFRAATTADLPLLEAGALQPARVAETTSATTTKKKGVGGLILGILALTTVVVLAASATP